MYAATEGDSRAAVEMEEKKRWSLALTQELAVGRFPVALMIHGAERPEVALQRKSGRDRSKTIRAAILVLAKNHIVVGIAGTLYAMAIYSMATGGVLGGAFRRTCQMYCPRQCGEKYILLGACG